MRLLPPAVYDSAGHDVTPSAATGRSRATGYSRFLALRLDDSAPPQPYVIDPLTIVGSPGGTGNHEDGLPAHSHEADRRRRRQPDDRDVVSVSDGRTTQGLTQALRHVSSLTPDEAFLYGSHHVVRVIVVDADAYGPALARDLQRVFPATSVVALSNNGRRRAALQSRGIVTLPASTPPAQVAAFVVRLLHR